MTSREPVPTGPIFGPPQRSALLLAAGPYAEPFRHEGWTVPEVGDIPYLAGVYVLVDSAGRLLRLGQAQRNGGVRARIRDHLQHRARGPLIEHAWVVGVDDYIDACALSVIEGRAADVLGLRARMPGLAWPSSKRWEELVERLPVVG